MGHVGNAVAQPFRMDSVPGAWEYTATNCSWASVWPPVEAPNHHVLDAWLASVAAHPAYQCSSAPAPGTYSLKFDWAETEGERSVPSSCASSYDYWTWRREATTGWEKENWMVLTLSHKSGSTLPCNDSEASIYIKRSRGPTCPPGWDVGFWKCTRNYTTPSVEKAVGPPNCGNGGTCNPINPATGNKYRREVDYVGAGPFPLRFERHWNSSLVGELFMPGVGRGWRHSYQRSVDAGDYIAGVAPAVASLYREDGKRFWFKVAGSIWTQDPPYVSEDDVEYELDFLAGPNNTPTGWRVTTPEGVVETYDADGKLLSLEQRGGLTQTLAYDVDGNLASVTDHAGRQLLFTWMQPDWRGYLLETLTDPAGNVYRYPRSLGNAMLTEVVYPDETPADDSDNPSKTYLYEIPNTGLLTGIIDENGQRYATFDYDTANRAILSELGGGAERSSITYNTNGTVASFSTTRIVPCGPIRS